MTDVTANDGVWHLICTTWSSSRGEWEVYKDGHLADSGTGLAKGRSVEAGGLLVIGQEQDEPGGKFSAAESFHGRMTRLDVWSRVLDSSEVRGIKSQCDSYQGDLLGWPEVHTGLRGHIKVHIKSNPVISAVSEHFRYHS